MPHSRFFLNTPFQVDVEVLLVGEEAHHLTRVMRKKEGELIELVNGNNQLATAQILSFEKKGTHLQLVYVEEAPPPSFPIILCQALPRLNRLDTLVEKGTELGMTELWLFPGELSEKKELSPTQLKRLEMITIAAMKQSGRLDLPKITLNPPLIAWSPQKYPAYFGATTPSAPPFLSLYKPERGVLFFIGPEAGFTPQETHRLLSLGAQGVKLHPNILRTDTASLVALTLIAAAQY